MKETIPILLNRRKIFTQRQEIRQECFVPSVLERLQCLFSSLQKTQHPYRDQIHDIIVDIESFPDEESRPSYMDSLEFEDCYDLYRKVTSAHKKHTDILRSVLYHESDSFMTLCTNDCHTLRVPLPLYIGNLFIIFFCMGHCVSGIVEGLSEKTWLTKLVHDFSKTASKQNSMSPAVISPIDLYHAFLLYHSTILRTYPLRPSQMIELGIAKQTMVDCIRTTSSGQNWFGNRNYNDCFLAPPKVMKGMDKAYTLDRIMNAGGVEQGCSVFSTTFEFGSLGPAFRGRDNISHIYFTPTIRLGIQYLADLEDGYKYDMNCRLSRYAAETALDDANRSSSHPFHALMNIIRESTKVRPINVEVPRIIFHTNAIQPI
jgi:hypothetical protein